MIRVTFNAPARQSVFRDFYPVSRRERFFPHTYPPRSKNFQKFSREDCSAGISEKRERGRSLLDAWTRADCSVGISHPAKIATPDWLLRFVPLRKLIVNPLPRRRNKNARLISRHEREEEGEKSSRRSSSPREGPSPTLPSPPTINFSFRLFFPWQSEYA